MIQNEFREVEDIILSPALVTQENINHHCKINTKIQTIYFLNLNMIWVLNYLISKFYFNLEKVTDDTFLKMFDTNLLQKQPL